MRKTVVKLYTRYKEIITYILFGIATTAINWMCYSILVKYFSIQFTISNSIAWIISVLFAYVTNKMFVFGNDLWEKKILLKEIILFISTRFISGVFEIVSLPILYNLGVDQSLFGVKGFLAKIIVSVIVVILNYIFSKLIIFK